jgi:hypothetical protein
MFSNGPRPGVIMAILSILVCQFLGLLNAAPVAAPVAKIPKPSPDSPQRIELTRVQVFLDRAGFRPGKIDGLGGEFTQKAADRYCDSMGVPRGTILDISSVNHPYREYVVAEEDLEWVGPVSTDPARQAKFKRLLYGNLWEAIAERFHCDQGFLVELNPEVTEIAVGTTLRVPDVEEFRLADVKALEKPVQQDSNPTPCFVLLNLLPRFWGPSPPSNLSLQFMIYPNRSSPAATRALLIPRWHRSFFRSLPRRPKRHLPPHHLPCLSRLAGLFFCDRRG